MIRRAIPILMLLAVTGCLRLGGGEPEPLHLYTLHPTVPARSAPPVDLAGAGIGIGPVALPDYLQRSQVVTLAGRNEYRLAPDGRWAEPLEENLLRVLAENLSRLTGSERIVTFPWRASLEPDYRVRLDVQRFEAADDGLAHLVVQWTVDPPGSGAPRMGRFAGEAAVEGGGTGAVVAAMAEAAGGLSRELAQALKDAANPKDGAGGG